MTLRQWHTEFLTSRGYDATPYPATTFIYEPSRLSAVVDGYTLAALSAVSSSDLDALTRLIKAGMNPAVQNAQGQTLLHRAGRHGKASVLQYLIKAGVHPRCADVDGKTPLHDTCWTSVTQIQAGLDCAAIILSVDGTLLRAMDKHGFTPLDFVNADIAEIWKLFISQNADALYPLDKAPGKTPQQWANELWPSVPLHLSPSSSPPPSSSAAAVPLSAAVTTGALPVFALAADANILGSQPTADGIAMHAGVPSMVPDSYVAPSFLPKSLTTTLAPASGVLPAAVYPPSVGGSRLFGSVILGGSAGMLPPSAAIGSSIPLATAVMWNQSLAHSVFAAPPPLAQADSPGGAFGSGAYLARSPKLGGISSTAPVPAPFEGDAAAAWLEGSEAAGGAGSSSTSAASDGNTSDRTSKSGSNSDSESLSGRHHPRPDVYEASRAASGGVASKAPPSQYEARAGLSIRAAANGATGHQHAQTLSVDSWDTPSTGTDSVETGSLAKRMRRNSPDEETPASAAAESKL